MEIIIIQKQIVSIQIQILIDKTNLLFLQIIKQEQKVTRNRKIILDLFKIISKVKMKRLFLISMKKIC